MAEAAKSKVWKVEQKVVSDDAPTRVRLIRATRRSEVEAFLLNEHTIGIATQDDLLDHGKTVQVENIPAVAA